MKKLLFLVLFVVPLFAQNGRVIVKQFAGTSADSVVTTYTNSQIDTVLWYRTEPTVSAISFAAVWDDTVRTANASACVIKRIFKPTLTTTAGDTLAWSAKISTQTAVNGTFVTGFALSGTPTFAPYADIYAFIVSYNSTGNAHASRSRKVKYIVHKIYNER